MIAYFILNSKRLMLLLYYNKNRKPKLSLQFCVLLNKIDIYITAVNIQIDFFATIGNCLILQIATT